MKLYSKPYWNINEFIETATKGLHAVSKNKVIDYYNAPCSFDIETTNFIDADGEKAAIMYVWQFGLNGYVCMGRTWADFHYLVEKIVEKLKIRFNQRLICYVHNLGFEFGFIQNRFQWSKVFCNRPRNPIYALAQNGIEFRCSFLLSGYSLGALSNQLEKHDIKKLSGDLDYTKIRHSKTPLTEQEIDYCVNDALVVMAYIAEQIDRNGDIANIPLTKTGYARRYCREKCLPEIDGKRSRDWWRYHNLMMKLTLDVEEYHQAKRAFQGGFTHANFRYVGKTVENVHSFDFTSSYPYVMVSHMFPMSKGKLIDHPGEKFRYYINNYCCLFDVKFTNIAEREGVPDNIISKSRCWNLSSFAEKKIKHLANNGRIVFADELETTITDVDFRRIEQFYTWETMQVANFRIYRRGYLPRAFIMAVLDLYEAKTKLKGVEERKDEYNRLKELLNSLFG